jgi:hypothetical protein
MAFFTGLGMIEIGEAMRGHLERDPFFHPHQDDPSCLRIFHDILGLIMARFAVDASVWIMSSSFAMISMTGSTFNHRSSMGRRGDPFVTQDTGNPSVNGLSILSLINIKRD